jgi:enoyl-CoA hydratase
MLSMSTDETLIYQTDGAVAIVTLNRPSAMNALTPDMLARLYDAFAEFERDDRLRVAILTGAGEKSFCAGADLALTIPEGIETAVQGPTQRPFAEVFKPIIAAVNGYCIAGGLELLQGTDLRVAAEHATFGLAEVRWGIVPAAGSHVRLPRQIPWAVAMELLLTGERITAARAYDIGLVNRVVAADDVMNEARRLADVICRNGPVAVRTAKEIAVRSLALDVPFALEYYLAERVFATEDAVEGPKAFMEKRTPRFVGH